MNVTQYDIRFTTKTPPHNEVRGSLFIQNLSDICPLFYFCFLPYSYLLVVRQLIIFTTNLPATGSVVAFSVHMVEIIASPFPSAICNIVSPSIDSIRSMMSYGFPPSF